MALTIAVGMMPANTGGIFTSSAVISAVAEQSVQKCLGFKKAASAEEITADSISEWTAEDVKAQIIDNIDAIGDSMQHDDCIFIWKEGDELYCLRLNRTDLKKTAIEGINAEIYSLENVSNDLAGCDVFYCTAFGFGMISSAEDVQDKLSDVSSSDAKNWLIKNIDAVKAAAPDDSSTCYFLFRFSGKIFYKGISSDDLTAEYVGASGFRWNMTTENKALSNISSWLEDSSRVFVWGALDAQQTKRDISAADVTMKANSAEIAAVQYNGTCLSEGTDYTVTYMADDGTALGSTPTEAGSYIVIISGIGEYTGEIRKPFTIVTYTAPAVTFEKGDGSVKLSWTAVEGAEQYGIAGEQNGKWTLLKKCESTSYTLSGLTAGKDYRVAVVAMIGGKWMLDYSNAVTVTPADTAVSLYPVVQTQVKDSKIGFKWNKIPGAEKYGIGVYQANKWVVKKQLDGSITTWTSPQVRSGRYRLVVLAKVGGQWINADVFKKSFYVTVP